MEDLLKKLEESADYIKQRINRNKIDGGLVLGSGLGEMADSLSDSTIIDYKDIPNFPVSTVPGHKGRLVVGKLGNKIVACMQGRFHYYEGYSMDKVVFPIQVMKKLSAEFVILTNAAGCVNKDWKPGDLMLITDHIKLSWDNPMRGPNEDKLGLRFFDMSHAYDSRFLNIAKEEAKNLGINLREGVYMFLSGPSFETPAEIRAVRTLGADAVGMSTVPEVIAASHCNLKVLGISCLTNMAAGVLGDVELNHEEVLETGLKVKKVFSQLIRNVVEKI